MNINRTLLLREPGKILFKGAHLYSQGDLTVKPVVANASITTSIHGTVDRARVTDRMFTISGVLAGEWKDLNVLFHCLSLNKGASVFGISDSPLIVHGQSGTKITFPCAAITKPPTIIGAAGKTLFGEFEATCLIANNSPASSSASYFTIATETYPGDDGFDPATLLTLPLTAAWGTSPPWDSFLTREGWTITTELSLTPEVVDGLGTVDMKIADLQVTATATPAGVTPAHILEKLSFGQGMGARRPAGDDLILTADGVHITLTDCVITDSALTFGDSPQIGSTTWTASRTWDQDGNAIPLLTLADATPIPT